jgi:hypothetical protein
MTGLSAAVRRAVPDAAEHADADARMRALLSRPDPGPPGERLVLLHFRGRRSGRRYDVPAGLHRLGDRLVVATGSGWRHNFTGGLAAEVTWRGTRRPAVLRLITATDEIARGYLELVSRYGATAAQRRLGIVITVDRTPTLDEVRDAVHRCGLSLVELCMEEEVSA